MFPILDEKLLAMMVVVFAVIVGYLQVRRTK